MSDAIEYEAHETADKRRLKVTKDTRTFGGPNMWHLHVRDADGSWRQVQWMNASDAERIMGFKLPRYTSDETVSRTQPSDR